MKIINANFLTKHDLYKTLPGISTLHLKILMIQIFALYKVKP